MTNLESLTPTPVQAEAIRTMLASPTRSSLNGSLMSAGKTLTGTELLKGLDAKFVLIIAPINTHTGWSRTLTRQGVTLPIRVINSTKAGKSALADYQWQLDGVYLIGPELFARWSWNGKAKSGLFAQMHDLVIFDEAHRGANRQTKTHKALMQVKAKYRHSMSGTVTGNKFSGAWAPCRWLFPDQVGASYYAWEAIWCETKPDYFAPQGKVVVGEKNPGAFFASLPCYVRIEPRIDVDVDMDQVYVTLGHEQRKQYVELEKNMVTYIQENPLVVEFPITLRARLRQATLGTLTIDDDGEVSFPEDTVSVKLDALYTVLEDDFEGEPTLLGMDSRKFANVTVARLNARYGAGTAVAWTGDVPQKRREEIKADWIAGRVKYVVAVIAAAAEGLDGFQFATRNIVLLNRSDNRIMVDQFISRVHRTGQTRLVRVRELIAENTYDLGVLSDQMESALKMNQSLRGHI